MPCKYKIKNLQKVVKLDENAVGPKPSMYFQKTNDGKKLLREMMGRYLPKDVVSAKKQGFSAPDASWFRGESIDYVKTAIFDKKAPIYQLLDFKPVTELVSVHLYKREPKTFYMVFVEC